MIDHQACRRGLDKLLQQHKVDALGEGFQYPQDSQRRSLVDEQSSKMYLALSHKDLSL
jgi:hypothetical protein